MLFESDSDADFFVAANNTKTVKMRDGSIHRLPVASKSSMKYLSEKKLKRQTQQRKKDVETNEPQKDSEQHGDLLCSSSSVQKDRAFQAFLGDNHQLISIESSNTSSLSILDMVDLTKNVKDILKFLRDKGLLYKEIKCEGCNCEMTIIKHIMCKDSEVFRCNKYKSTKSIRTGSFFNCRLKLKQILLIMYFWSCSLQGFMVSYLLPKINDNTIYDYYSFCRDITIQKKN